MGGTQSKTSIAVTNQTAISSITQNIMQCVSTATQNQLIGAGFVGGNVDISNVTLSQGTAINTSCVMQSNVQSSITADLGTALAQAAASAGQAALSAFGNTQSQAASNITNRLNIAISNTNLQQDFNNATQNQNIEFGVVEGNFIMHNVTISQTASVVAQNLLNTQAYSSVVGTVANTIQQSANASEANPIAGIIDAVGGSISSVSTPYAIAIGMVALLLIFAVWWFFIRKH
jgi:hypothetical protein